MSFRSSLASGLDHHCKFCKYNFETLAQYENHFIYIASCKSLKLDEDRKRQRERNMEEAKAMDQAKQEERDRAARQEREAVEALEREEKETLAMKEKLKASLPSEPATTDKDIIAIRLRFPAGDQYIRRFRMDEPVKWLVVYAESLGVNMKTYRLLTSDVPQKDVATLDNNKTFRELKWPPREQITIDEK